MTVSRLLVAGAGPVGLAFACACRGEDVQVIEAAPARPSPGEAYDHRVYALSAGSRRFLRDLGAWERMDAARIAPVRRMEIHGDAGARLSFTGQAGAPLAWIVEASRLSSGLEEEAAEHGAIRLQRGQALRDCGAGADGAWLELADGQRIEGDLLVGADGADSRVRALAGLAADVQPYDETALVANFATEREHGDCARQWFRADGVLAWLPLPGRRMSIVWSAHAPAAEELRALDERAFERRVREAGGAELGDLELISPVGAFPLRRIDVARAVAPGVALVGDAAHAVHPLAGQGVNLGFQDARALAEEIGARSAVERPGDLRVLRRYERARREDVGAMQFVTSRLDALFAAEGPGASLLRNAGLRLVDAQPWAKAALARRAMR